MKTLIIAIFILFVTLVFSSCEDSQNNYDFIIPEKMIIRIAELDIDPDHLSEYLLILQEEADASVRLEPGVISIYPMYQKENPTQIRILEIYANQEAYDAHLNTPHFKHYKKATLDAVKSLKLVDMEAIQAEIMFSTFVKLKHKR